MEKSRIHPDRETHGRRGLRPAVFDHGLARGFQGADEGAGVGEEAKTDGVLSIPVGVVMAEVVGRVVLSGDLDAVQEVWNACVVAGEQGGGDGDSGWVSRGRVCVWSS